VPGSVGSEAKSFDKGVNRVRIGLRKRPVQPLHELRLEQVELLRPGRRAAGDGHHAVSFRHRLGLGSDPGAGGGRPGTLGRRQERPRLGASPRLA
jgi:hypothetical protein